MCVSCGCGEGHDDHGSADNITADKIDGPLSQEALERAARAQGISVEEARRNVEATLKRARR
ncbi:MAG: hypothetical protein ACRDKS_12325 [Actinomycetota bacterium]